jgi:RimJ/RimL family protein N-acetyltransferase
LIRTTDREYIRSVFTHPSIYPFVSEDHDPPADKWEPVVNEHAIYLRPEEGGACFLFHPHTRIVWEVHSAVLPEYREHSLEYVTACAEWLRQNTPCKCLLTRIPKGNVRARRLAEAVGMRLQGILPNSFLKDGRLIDQAILTMEIPMRESDPCPQPAR